MSKLCSNFQIKIYASYWFILKFLRTGKAVNPCVGGTSWMNNAAARLRAAACTHFSPLERYRTLEVFLLKKQHNFTDLERTGRGKSHCLSLTVSSINTNWKVYSLWSDEMVGRIITSFLLCEEEHLFSDQNNPGKVSSDWQHLYLKSFICTTFFFVKSWPVFVYKTFLLEDKLRSHFSCQ